MTAADPRHRATVRYRARFDECNPDGVVRSSGLLRWAQDLAWIHSERLGFTRDWYAERSLGWLVRCLELNVLGHVALGETVAATTGVVGYRKVIARRRTQVVRETGEPVAVALTDWVLVDARGLPTRIPAEFAAIFGGVESFEPARVRLGPTPDDAVALPFTVRDHEIDPMAHANNAVYVDWIDEAARALGVSGLSRYRLEYLVPAVLGANVIGRVWRTERGVDYRLTSASGTELLRAEASGDAGVSDPIERTGANRG